MEKSLDEKIYDLSYECKESLYSNVEHKEVLRQLAVKLEKLAKELQYDHWVSMQESM